MLTGFLAEVPFLLEHGTTPSFHILGLPYLAASTFWVLRILGLGSPYLGSTLNGTVRVSGRPKSSSGPLGSLHSHHGRTLKLILQNGPASFQASNLPLQRDRSKMYLRYRGYLKLRTHTVLGPYGRSMRTFIRAERVVTFE